MLKRREVAYRMHSCASFEYPGACPRELYLSNLLLKSGLSPGKFLNLILSFAAEKWMNSVEFVSNRQKLIKLAVNDWKADLKQIKNPAIASSDEFLKEGLFPDRH
jgi:hypothetical protein